MLAHWEECCGGTNLDFSIISLVFVDVPSFWWASHSVVYVLSGGDSMITLVMLVSAP